MYTETKMTIISLSDYLLENDYYPFIIRWEWVPQALLTKLKYFEKSGISVIKRNIRTHFRKKNTTNAPYIKTRD